MMFIWQLTLLLSHKRFVNLNTLFMELYSSLVPLVCAFGFQMSSLSRESAFSFMLSRSCLAGAPTIIVPSPSLATQSSPSPGRGVSYQACCCLHGKPPLVPSHQYYPSPFPLSSPPRAEWFSQSLKRTRGRRGWWVCRPEGWISCLLPVRPGHGCTGLGHGVQAHITQCLSLYLEFSGLIPFKVTLFFYIQSQVDFTLSSFIKRADWALIANIRLIFKSLRLWLQKCASC